MEFRTRYSKHDANRYAFHQLDEVSMTRQSEADEADINKVMARFMRTGQLPQTNSKQPRYGDAIGLPYDQALIAVKAAEAAFLKLPSAIRKELGNDPAQLESWLNDPANTKKAVELGLKSYVEPTEKQLLTEVVKNTKKSDEKPDDKNLKSEKN